jgi:hypothetical protein
MAALRYLPGGALDGVEGGGAFADFGVLNYPLA